MNAQLVSTLLRVAILAIAIIIVIVVARLRGFSLTEDLGLRWPRPAIVFLWLARRSPRSA